MSVNKVILVGRVGKDPEVKYMTSGDAVVNFSLATSERWKDKAGAQQEKTEWHNCTVYRQLAEVIGEYVAKGHLLYVEGKLSTRKWQDKEGKDRYTTEVILDKVDFLTPKSDSVREQADSAGGGSPQKAPDKAYKPAIGSFDNFDDDIPFS